MKKILIICLIFLTFVQQGAASPTSEYLKITAEVNNGYAITTVEEKLLNPSDRAVQDEFSFLIPEEAFISGFSLIIDGREYQAEILQAEEAAEKFEVAASAGRTAGLLETKENNLFSYALSFEPGQSIIVKLAYEQALKKSLGEYELVQYLQSPHVVNTLSVGINISSANPLIRLETPGFSGAEARYLSSNQGHVSYETNTLPGSELRVIFATENPPLTGNMLFYEKEGNGYLMHIFSPSEEDLGTTALRKDIIFVLDKSGSMQGQKIEQVKTAFGNIISSLPNQDRFNIIFFDSSVQTYSENLRDANAGSKAEALNFVNSLEAEGGTNINEALLRALGMFSPESERVPIIVFLTDGEATDGVTSPYVIRQNVKAANSARVSVFSIAFGIEDDSNYDFLRTMSLENYGTAEWFAPKANAEEKIGSFYETISTPLITDLEFSYGEGVSELVNTGERNLFAGSDAIVLGKYSSGSGSIHSELLATTRAGSRSFSDEFTVAPTDENAFIPRLWAYTTIDTLLDRIKVEGEKEGLVDAVTKLALEFEFVTPYTSLFVELPEVIGEAAENPAAAPAAAPAEAPAESMEAEEVAVDSSQDYIDGNGFASSGSPQQQKPISETEAVHEEEAAEAHGETAIDEKSTPGIGMFLSLIGLLGTAFLLVRRQERKL